MNTIYAYSIQTYLDIEKNWFKVGQTKGAAPKRVKQQDGTSNAEPLLLQQDWRVPNAITDYKLHKHFESMGYHKTRDDVDREWYEIPFNEIAKAVNELHYGIARPNDYATREEQEACIIQAVEWFLGGGAEFLMDAKMRFGKTFTTYQIIKELEYKTVLILTYKPSVKSAWAEDLQQHVDFDGWNYFENLDDMRKDRKSKVKVLFASFQDLNDFDKDKWKGIDKVNFDLTVVDEMHYGSATEKAKQTMEHIKSDRKLFLSGTPMEALISGRFSDDNTYHWTYADEQSKRRAEKESGWETDVYRWLPEMEIHSFEVCDAAKAQSILYTGEEQFTVPKMLASDDGITFNDEATVKLFLDDQFFGRGVRKNKSPIRTYAPDHSILVVPGVKEASALTNLLNKMVGDDYMMLNVTGNNIKSLAKVKRAIALNDKTITITCGRFNTGVTVPEWDAVFMLTSGKAAETYFQTIFRVQSQNRSKGKEKCVCL